MCCFIGALPLPKSSFARVIAPSSLVRSWRLTFASVASMFQYLSANSNCSDGSLETSLSSPELLILYLQGVCNYILCLTIVLFISALTAPTQPTALSDLRVRHCTVGDIVDRLL